MRYGYEILGGILIFASSLVTEQMPDKWKRRSWIIFGLLAVIYIVVGVGLDRQAAASETADRHVREAQTNAINALSGVIDPMQVELATVQNQNSIILKFVANNLTKEQARELFEAVAKAAANQKQPNQKTPDLELLALREQLLGAADNIRNAWSSWDTYHHEDHEKVAHSRDYELNLFIGIRNAVRDAKSVRDQALRIVPRIEEDNREDASFNSVILDQVIDMAAYLQRLADRVSAVTPKSSN